MYIYVCIYTYLSASYVSHDETSESVSCRYWLDQLHHATHTQIYFCVLNNQKSTYTHLYIYNHFRTLPHMIIYMYINNIQLAFVY